MQGTLRHEFEWGLKRLRSEKRYRYCDSRSQKNSDENRDDPKDFLYMDFRLLTQCVCHKLKLIKITILQRREAAKCINSTTGSKKLARVQLMERRKHHGRWPELAQIFGHEGIEIPN
jgi:hypothetical protein